MGGRGLNELGVPVGTQVQGRGGEAAGQAVRRVTVPLDVSTAQCQAEHSLGTAPAGPGTDRRGSPPEGRDV